ncbi:unnamed protein product [Somion occarium]|uniref:Uncharacterized protein n=1 Tax=Somion occarium TaxID=3059160 RepID=A0ABP1DM21_9APHY
MRVVCSRGGTRGVCGHDELGGESMKIREETPKRHASRAPFKGTARSRWPVDFIFDHPSQGVRKFPHPTSDRSPCPRREISGLVLSRYCNVIPSSATCRNGTAMTLLLGYEDGPCTHHKAYLQDDSPNEIGERSCGDVPKADGRATVPRRGATGSMSVRANVSACWVGWSNFLSPIFSRRGGCVMYVVSTWMRGSWLGLGIALALA